MINYRFIMSFKGHRRKDFNHVDSVHFVYPLLTFFWTALNVKQFWWNSKTLQRRWELVRLVYFFHSFMSVSNKWTLLHRENFVFYKFYFPIHSSLWPLTKIDVCSRPQGCPWWGCSDLPSIVGICATPGAQN